MNLLAQQTTEVISTGFTVSPWMMIPQILSLIILLSFVGFFLWVVMKIIKNLERIATAMEMKSSRFAEIEE